MTGGQAFFPTSLKELDSDVREDPERDRARYTLGYTSTDDKRGRRVAPVEIRLKRPI